MELTFPPMVLCLDGSRFNHFNKIDGVFTNSSAMDVLPGHCASGAGSRGFRAKGIAGRPPGYIAPGASPFERSWSISRFDYLLRLNAHRDLGGHKRFDVDALWNKGKNQESAQEKYNGNNIQ